MAVLRGLEIVQSAMGWLPPFAAVCFADIGARVVASTRILRAPLAAISTSGKTVVSGDRPRGAAIAAADLIVCEGGPRELRARQCDPDTLRRINPNAAMVLISPFGQTGPQADDPASDLTLFFASGIARMLTGQVDDLDEAPIRPVGEQSAFIGGIAAACAGMHAVHGRRSDAGAIDRRVDPGGAGDDGDHRAGARRA